MPEQINPLSITTLSDTGKDILMVSPHLVEVTDSPIHAISTSATADRMDTKNAENHLSMSRRKYIVGEMSLGQSFQV